MSSTIVLKRPPAAAMTSTSASPKAPKNKANPSLRTQALYGCEHVKKLLQSNPETVKMSKSYYSGATRVALDSHRTTAQTCSKCTGRHYLTKTMLCMQCPNIHCPRDADAHSKEVGHMFGIDSRTGHVYCFMCQDYIYDPTLEEIRMEREAAMEGGTRKKRRIEAANFSPEDLRYIETNTTLAPCRATGLRGFLNMGATCFMSVVLQSLIHNPLVRNFYLADGHKPKECSQSNCMSCAMDEVFVDFFTSPDTSGFGPINLLTTSWKCQEGTEKSLAGYQQQDAHEYLQFLLNQLHTTNGGIDTKTEPCKCIIHRAFYGKLQSDVTCDGCKNVTTALDPVMDLSLDLRIKDKKRSAVNGAGAGDGTMQTLQECLERFTKEERLGANEYNCSKCEGKSEATITKQLSVKRLPPVLCIQLKRFEHSATGSSKVDAKIRFPMILDMTPYTTRAKRKTTSVKATVTTTTTMGGSFMYDLLSVVVHTSPRGQTNTGHYVSYSRENGQWFLFDDSKVTLARESEVLAAEAYLLFYIVRNLS